MELYKGHSISAFPGLTSSVEVMQPREPGKLTASLNNPFGNRYFTTGNVSPPREIKKRDSLGGGFKFPKSLLPAERQVNVGIDYPDYIGKIYIDEEPKRDFIYDESDNVLISIEQTLQRLKQESQSYAQVRGQPVTQSLLHSHSMPHQNHPQYEERIDPDQPNTIKELEILRENHKAKLMQLEVEYMRKRRDGHAGIPGVSNTVGKTYSSEYTGWNFKRETSPDEFTDKPVRKQSPDRIRYEAKFENYLKRKNGGKEEKPVIGKPVKLSLIHI